MSLLPLPGKHIGDNGGNAKKSKSITLFRQNGSGVRKLSVASTNAVKIGITNFKTGSGGGSGIGFYWR